ncbi:uncharacterized protein DNG_05496 [Cephalotrichum gorgonifer]|uniref:Uncharacterized protein n=1 Tax=Cephalotrichum gorgonifer TaxID=2041049 RepID=A0AAE8SVJ3_9PEZI|nr:uncharacterized protein DNG_05496 [Cephalotrichum gorgonifer]
MTEERSRNPPVNAAHPVLTCAKSFAAVSRSRLDTVDHGWLPILLQYALPSAQLTEIPFRIPSAYDSPQLLEFVFGLKPDVAEEGCMLAFTKPLPLTYEDYIEGEMERIGLSGPTRNILSHIALKVGPEKFDIFVALTGYAAERYTYLGYLDGIIYTNLIRSRLKAKARGKPMSDVQLNFRRGIKLPPSLIIPDNLFIDPSKPHGKSGCPRGTRTSATLAGVLAKGTREARGTHAPADIHRSLAWDRKEKARVQEEEARQEARAKRMAKQG